MGTGFCAALTGGIACGKSAVAAVWKSLGAEVLDADDVVHGLIGPDGACTEAVAKAFGPDMRAPGGGIDRARLGRRIFADPEARKRLEALLHPEVIRRTRAWAEDIRRSGRQGAAVVPLLFEAGMARDWDAVVCVASDVKTILKRLAERGLSPDEARQRIASQWPVGAKCAQAGHVIENNGSLAELEEKSRALWTHLTKQGD